MLAAGCGFDSSTALPEDPFIDADLTPRDAGPILDALAPDAVPDADPGCDPDAVLGFAVTNINPCQLPPRAEGTTVLDSLELIDTSTFSAANALILPQTNGGPDVLVLHYEDVVLQRQLITGSVPLVIVADSITVGGHFHVRASFRTGSSPGANVECADGIGLDGDLQPDSPGYRGGSGGGFAAAGGKGGEAEGGGSKKIPGGVANGNAEISPLRGGCSGGHGGRLDLGMLNTVANSIGGGGSGGGAIQLIASESIHVLGTGVLAAPGRGGGSYYVVSDMFTGGADRAGGSGGGSGGAIFLEAPSITIDSGGYVLALGGAGGEGRDADTGDASDPGDGAAPLDDFAIPALGGSTSNQDGGDGGKGSDDKDNSKGDDGSPGKDLGSGDRSGGGGGGGGTGRIRLRAVGGTPTVNGVVYPPALEQ